MAKKTIGAYKLKIEPFVDSTDVKKVAEELDRETNKILSKESKSRQLETIKSQMKQTSQTTQELVDRLNDVTSTDFETKLTSQIQAVQQEFRETTATIDGYEEALSSLSEAQNLVSEAQAMESEYNSIIDKMEQMPNYLHFSAEEYDALQLQAVEYRHKLDDIYARLSDLGVPDTSADTLEVLNAGIEESQSALTELVAHRQELMNQLADLNKQDVDGRKKLEKELREEIDKCNDKLKLQIAKYMELDRASQKSGKGQVKSFNGISAGASKVLKVLKRGAIAIAGLVLGARGLYSIFNKLRSAIISGFKTIYDNDEEFKKQIDDLKNSFDEIKVNLAEAFMPIVQMAIPYIKQLLNWVNQLITKIAMFTAAITGQKAFTKAIKESGEAARKASSQLSKLDELNVISTQDDWGFEESPMDAATLDTVNRLKEAFSKLLEMLKELIGTPFLKGLNFDEILPKLERLKDNVIRLGENLLSIWSDPRLQAAMENYVKTVSETLGKVIGAGLSIGAELGNLLLSGLNKFLEEHKGEIVEKLSGLLGKESEFYKNIGDLADAFRRIFDGIGENENAINIASNFFDTLWQGLSTYANTQLQIILDLQKFATLPIVENTEKWKAALDSLLMVLSPLSDLIDSITVAVSDWIQGFTDAFSMSMNTITHLFSGLVGKILDFWTKISPAVQVLANQLKELWDEYVQPIGDDLISILKDVSDILSTMVTWLWDNMLSPILDFFNEFIAPIAIPLIAVMFTNIIAFVKTVFAVIRPLFDFVKDFFSLIKHLIHGDFKAAGEDFLSMLDDLFVAPIRNVLTVFKETWDHSWELLQQALTVVADLVTDAWDFWRNLLTGAWNFIKVNILQTAWNEIKAWFTVAITFIKAWWENQKALFQAGILVIRTLIDNFKNSVVAIFNTIKSQFSTFVGALKSTLTGAITAFTTGLNNLYSTVNSIVVKISNRVTSVVKSTIDTVKTAFRNGLNIVIGFINTLISGSESALNRLVRAANSLHFEIPYWVPEVGGRSFGVNLSTVSFGRIPALATGAVIPPSMGEFIAKLGDNNKETEVVSPLSTMKQAVIEALQQAGGVGGGDIHVHVDLDGREVAKCVVRQDDIARRSRGIGLFGT